MCIVSVVGDATCAVYVHAWPHVHACWPHVVSEMLQFWSFPATRWPRSRGRRGRAGNTMIATSARQAVTPASACTCTACTTWPTDAAPPAGKEAASQQHGTQLICQQTIRVGTARARDLVSRGVCSAADEITRQRGPNYGARWRIGACCRVVLPLPVRVWQSLWLRTSHAELSITLYAVCLCLFSHCCARWGFSRLDSLLSCRHFLTLNCSRHVMPRLFVLFHWGTSRAAS